MLFLGENRWKGFCAAADIMRRRVVLYAVAAVMVLPAGAWAAVSPGPPDESASAYQGYHGDGGSFEPSSQCSICHETIHAQFRESMHAKSYENPFFRAAFFKELLPRHREDRSLTGEAAGCIACHAPVMYTQMKGKTISVKSDGPDPGGVECDFCHRISGYKGEEPGSANYAAEPGRQKFGPFAQTSDWHHVYSELQTKSEICGICHNRVNRHGLEIISTFTEWRESRYAKHGIQCQDCHMTVQGFLTAGKPVYESGRASQNVLTFSPKRERLYTHRFPGAHSESQVKGAIQLEIRVDKDVVAAGEEIEVNVIVDNSKTGHKMPTGSAEFRFLYLDFTAEINDRVIPLSIESFSEEMFDVSGWGRFDADILTPDFPEGKRMYRAICVDPEGQQTLFSFDAERIVFDNRLQADEIRKEIFLLQVPENAGQTVALTAKLFYKRYPDSIAARLGLDKAREVELASATKRIAVARAGD
ncbi:MAG: multiheme c-type cytochrome [Desulfobulbaceae bacterium]|jgi:hypothetical protein|nr:multiheme c-type cytochrome [Desulfobulbaceae bacterium]MDY0351483.1 multiheme c-type cytochrome [Desulfobulbaceae bacterium]